MGKFDGVLIASDFDNTMVYTEGALRSGRNGEFVLVLREKQTVMGTEQTVAQVPVTVKARDSERVAVEADGLLPEDRVVVSSSKPIDQGDRVRVLDETA